MHYLERNFESKNVQSDPMNVKVSMYVAVYVSGYELVCVFRPDVAVCFEK